VVHVLLGLYAVLLTYIILGLVIGFNISADIFFDLSFALLFFTIAQSLYELRARSALLFIVFASVIGYATEVLGTRTGFPFGTYSYSDLLGPRVLGVPVVVPLIWFVITYVPLSILWGTFQHRLEVKNSKMLFSISAFTAFGAMAWDLLVDPMFTSYGYWSWSAVQPVATPRLSGVPLTNFIGWFVVAFVITAIRLRFTTAAKMDSVRSNTYDSIAVYVMLLIDGVVANLELGHYLVVGIGSLAMLAFPISSLVYSRKLKLANQKVIARKSPKSARVE